MSDGIWNGMELYKGAIYSIPQMTKKPFSLVQVNKNNVNGIM